MSRPRKYSVISGYEQVSEFVGTAEIGDKFEFNGEVFIVSERLEDGRMVATLVGKCQKDNPDLSYA